MVFLDLSRCLGPLWRLNVNPNLPFGHRPPDCRPQEITPQLMSELEQLVPPYVPRSRRGLFLPGGRGEDLWEQGRLSERARHRSAGDRPYPHALHPPLGGKGLCRDAKGKLTSPCLCTRIPCLRPSQYQRLVGQDDRAAWQWSRGPGRRRKPRPRRVNQLNDTWHGPLDVEQLLHRCSPRRVRTSSLSEQLAVEIYVLPNFGIQFRILG